MQPSAAPHAMPKYVQVSEMLIREIAAGHWADGTRLPPERDMANELEVSVGTLRKALADLEAKGLLERVQGSGNYVKHRPAVGAIYGLFRLELLRGGGLPTAQVLSVDRVEKTSGMPSIGDAVDGHRIRRIRSLGDQVIAAEEIWLDGGRCDEIDQANLPDSLYQFYRKELGFVIGSVADAVGVGNVPDWAGDAFHLNAGAVAGYVERISWTTEGDPAECSRTWFDYDRARYVSRMGKG